MSSPLKIGDVHIEHPFTQAALSGYSDLPMRRVARKLGASYTVHEVVLDRSVVYRSKWQSRLFTVEEGDHPVGAQLMGSAAEEFESAARMLVDAGYDVIDVNFGCPVRKVLRRHRGGYLLSEPKTALSIVSRVMDVVAGEKPVTVKMRRGLDDTAESERNFFTILDGVLEMGAAAVTVHGRTVVQKYTGEADWDFLARVKEHMGDRIMLGSGDLFTAADCLEMIKHTGVDGVTIARGAIGNPWIFRDCLALAAGESLPPHPSLAEQRRVIEAHFADAAEFYGKKLGNKFVRKFGIKYSRMHPHPKQVRDAFVNAEAPEGFSKVLDEWYPLLDESVE